MEKIVVIVLPKHLENNSWHHRYERRCPLQEALEEQGYECYVGPVLAYIFHNNPYPDSFSIDIEKWNQVSVSKFIEKANRGSQEAYILELEPITNKECI